MKNATQEKDDHGKSQALAQLASIKTLVKNLLLAEKHGAQGKDECGTEFERAESDIHDDALSVEMRTDWHSLSDNENKPTEFRILLCTGGPAVQIIGELNQYQEPDQARIEYQDWFTPWTPLTDLSEKDEKTLLRYCQCFYFGGENGA